MDKINVVLPEGVGDHVVVTVLEGKALDQQPVLAYDITGNILAPGEFLQKRKALGLIDAKNCVVVANAAEGTILLTEWIDSNQQQSLIGGRLKKDHILSQLNINNLEKTYDAKSLGKFLKKFRNYFNDREEFDTLIAALFKFSATVQTKIEDESDARGNSKKALEKAVDNNLPTKFVLKLPVFSGFPEEVFEVEICAEATTDRVSFWMESIDLLSREQSLAEQILKEETDKFQEFGCPVIWK